MYINEFREVKDERVITYGTFDLLHYGHINLLKRANNMEIILLLPFLQMNSIGMRNKNVILVMKRKQLLEAIRYVDLVIPEENWEQK